MQEPLAFRMRPQTLDEVIGQEHLISEGKILRRCIEEKQIASMIFYGPPGTGKTTLAQVIANELQLPYRMLNAVSGNKKDLETVFEEAKYYHGLILIIDEVHRLNKDKQDLLLPHVERGTITLIGATTANPLHAINPAIRSRTHLFEIKALTKEHIKQALLNALHSEKGCHDSCKIREDALDFIAHRCNGDLRFALNILEICALACENGWIDKELVMQYAQVPNQRMDSDGDGYYDVLSAFQKSIRGSDVDAALYYLGVLIQADDMNAIERRLLVCAYEDVGLGNPAAVARCMEAIEAAKRVGFPEARYPLRIAVIDLCLSPKSRSGAEAIAKVMDELKNQPYQVPSYLRYTPVNMDEDSRYDYGRSDLWGNIQYLPNHLAKTHFYEPQPSGNYENILAKNLEKLRSVNRYNDLKLLKKLTKKASKE